MYGTMKARVKDLMNGMDDFMESSMKSFGRSSMLDSLSDASAEDLSLMIKVVKLYKKTKDLAEEMASLTDQMTEKMSVLEEQNKEILHQLQKMNEKKTGA